MGYFSELDFLNKESYEDKSYPSFDMQLTWRYEDLMERYHELLDTDAPAVDDDYFSIDDYRYAPVGCFRTIAHVYRALEIAKEDLETKCNIVVNDDGSFERKSEEETDPNQMTIFEIVIYTEIFSLKIAA